MKAIKSDLEFELESYFQRRLSSSFHDQMEKIEKNEKSGKESERKIKPIKSSDGVKESKKRSIRKIVELEMSVTFLNVLPAIKAR